MYYGRMAMFKNEVKGSHRNIPHPIPERPVDVIFPEIKRQDSILNNKCINPPIGCGQPIISFKDKLSEKEWRISGLCQTCQDKIFGSE